MHDNNDRKVMAGKIDGASERALSSRFNVKGFPSFYLIDGWTVRQYDGERSVDALVKFATKTYENVEVSTVDRPLHHCNILVEDSFIMFHY